jgi:transposase
MPREQLVLFPHRLDEAVPPDHPVRLLDEVLRRLDWSGWEERYERKRGRPPLHPRVVAGPILHGLTLGIRSSRRLEDACRNRVDFLWLVEGRTIDHATFCEFINRFGEATKDLFVRVCSVAMEMGLITLNLVALDGTRVRSNSSRHATASASTLAARLKKLREEVASMLAEWQGRDAADRDLFGETESSAQLPRKLANAEKRLAVLEAALANAEAKEARQKPKRATDSSESEGKKKPPPRVPVADPDSSIQPNKEGGMAPNYTTTAAADDKRGYLVDADVLPDSNESQGTVPTADRIREGLESSPDAMSADGAFASGKNLAALEERGIEAFIPLGQRAGSPENPAPRPDPREPIPREQWAKLPRSAATKKLDRTAFVYDPEANCYYCPLGRPLTLWRTQKIRKGKAPGQAWVYRCPGSEACPLAGECIKGKAAYRTLLRDEYEELREAMDARMATERGQAVRERRMWLAETPFAFLKHWMQLRQFLRRGLSQVRVEWLWACTAYNVRKLVQDMAALRAASGSGAA